VDNQAGDRGTDRAAHIAQLLEAAHALHAAGCSVIPARADGSKAPAAYWKQYTRERPDLDQLTTWLTYNRHDGIGVITGTISGGPGGGYLEMLELEGRALQEHTLEALTTALADHGLDELWARITKGYLEATPSGGLHLLYRVTGEPRGNTKLARRPAHDGELTDDEKKILAGHPGKAFPRVLIETRGEGGYVVVAPSGGRTHPTGRAWTLLAGGPHTIATITEEERDALHAIASLLDTMPAAQPPTPQARQPSNLPDQGKRPGDEYNAKTDWADILVPHGWRHTRNFGRARGWCRPGKTGPHVSATTGRGDTDCLYVFTSSTEFDTDTPYTKFAAYTLLEHGGDYTAAARQLRRDGYGDPLPHDDDHITDLIAGYRPEVNGPFALETAGNLATVHQLHPSQNQPGDPHLSTADGHTWRYSDDRLALTLVAQYGDRIRYCPDRGHWLTWNGTRWTWTERGGGPVREYARHIGRSLPDQAGPDIKFKARALSANGVTSTLALAQTDPRIVIGINQLDAHPWELNTPAGIINLHTGALLPSNPARLHTRTTLTTPDPDADPAAWDEFLRVTFAGDLELTAYLRRLMGYSATGYIGPHVLPFSWGSGGNGKGVFLETAQHVLGDYATTAPVGFLMASPFPGHETEIARLAGARMVLCSEVNEDDKFDEARVKQLTGGDTLTARFMRQDHFTFNPTHHLWLMGNHQPSVTSGGRAFWRRLRLIPFTHEVPDAEIIEDLQGILTRDHGAAILNWIIRGAVEFSQQGLNPEPETVTAATSEYKKEQDTVARFVEECCRIGGGNNVQIKVSIVRAAYEEWCRQGGDRAVSPRALTQELVRHGAGRGRSGGGSARLYTNLSLLGEPDGDSDGDDDRDTGWYR
jgi:P4 family phage/plasmid primase-like protien